MKGKKEKLIKFLDSLSPADREDFNKELLDASFESVHSSSLKPIHDVLDIWLESAELSLDPEMMDRVRKAEDELERGDTVTWRPGM